MAMVEPTPQTHGNGPNRQGRRRPFSTLMKKLANFKGVASGDGNRHAQAKPNNKINTTHQSKNNHPYLQPSAPARGGSYYSLSTTRSERTRISGASLEPENSVTSFPDGQAPPTAGGRSVAPTVSTDHETSRSTTAPSHMDSSLAGTSRTANGTRGGDSTFSSPAPSVRSLTTTLTTIQSFAPNGAVPHHTNVTTNHHSSQANSQIIHFNQPFPTASPPSAVPAHLTPSVNAPGYPTTYATATANNLLTDNASILTLASSSKRRRRRSFDTDASVRALAPSSLFGNSRESLPLSILSANIEGAGGVAGVGVPTTPGLLWGPSMVAAERTSIYSATGILSSNDRNSFYAKQQTAITPAADGASVRSGLLGHGRADSVSGSVIGMASSPLTTPRELITERDREWSVGVEEEDEEDSDRHTGVSEHADEK